MQARAPGVRLVGRENELRAIDAALDAAREGSLHYVSVLGDPGSGKTRLAQEVLFRHRSDALTLSARAHAMGRTASFGLWVDAIESHLRTLSPEGIYEVCDGLLFDLAGLLRSVAVVHGQREAAPQPSVSGSRIVHALGALVANLTRERPLIVVLDDVHEADGSSWDVLHHLAGLRLGAGVLVVALARPGELPQEPAAMRVQLDLEQQGQLHRVALQPLSDAAVGELARELLGAALSPEAQKLLITRSGGNPLFALGLVQALRGSTGAAADVVLRDPAGHDRGLGAHPCRGCAAILAGAA